MEQFQGLRCICSGLFYCQWDDFYSFVQFLCCRVTKLGFSSEDKIEIQLFRGKNRQDPMGGWPKQQRDWWNTGFFTEKLLKTREGQSQYEQEGVAEGQLSQCRNLGWAQTQKESIQSGAEDTPLRSNAETLPRSLGRELKKLKFSWCWKWQEIWRGRRRNSTGK